MKSGIWNIGFGLVALAAGASKDYSLIGTSSSTALMAAGGVLAAFGLFQVIRALRAR
ncbi:MAG: hypothetical protein ACREJ3_11520 [Polyangiaceae bacterium]